MAFDGVLLSSITSELQELIGSRIEKIYQPEKNEIILHLRKPGSGYRLLLSANPTKDGVYLSTKKKENPTTPPLFCMVLRKHLQGGKIISFKQPGMERIIKVEVESLDELGNKVIRSLICEVMGKHSNIILLNESTQTILDSIKRIPPSISSRRQVLPNIIYTDPPSQNKLCLLDSFTDEQLAEMIFNSALNTKLINVLVKSFQGISPLTAKELLFRGGIDLTLTVNSCGELEISKLEQQLKALATIIKQGNFTPCIAFGKDIPFAFSSIELTHLSGNSRLDFFNSSSKAIDQFYQIKDVHTIFQNQYHKIKQILNSEWEKAYKKKNIQQADVKRADDGEKYKVMGELITANIYQISQGNTKVDLPNFYDPDQKPLTIELKPNLSPAENAQQYFKLYNKCKKTVKMGTEQLKKTESYLEYIESLQHSLEQSKSLNDLEDIYDEMVEQGIVIPTENKSKQPKKVKKRFQFEPYHFTSTTGFEIIVGKNNKQNDWLTLKASHKDDLWFHTKDIPGAHVVVKHKHQQQFDEQTIGQAAMLAAYFSKAKLSTNVPVDYTIVKHVKKPSGAKPGMVIYTNQSTIYVNPNDKWLESLDLP